MKLTNWLLGVGAGLVVLSGGAVHAQTGGVAAKLVPVYLLLLFGDDASSVDAVALNDTGIDWGGDSNAGNNTSCTSDVTGPQDCAQGNDATNDDDSDGHAGFSFTKLDAGGNALAASATSWSCVRDNVTSLVWEVKTDDDSIHDKDNAYAWGGVTHLGSGYGAYHTDWDALVNGTNSESLCGFSDWRVPTVGELENIVDFSDTSSMMIDASYFPNTASSVWSASPYANGATNAWYLNFDTGVSNSASRGTTFQVRLVRSGG